MTSYNAALKLALSGNIQLMLQTIPFSTWSLQVCYKFCNEWFDLNLLTESVFYIGEYQITIRNNFSIHKIHHVVDDESTPILYAIKTESGFLLNDYNKFKLFVSYLLKYDRNLFNDCKYSLLDHDVECYNRISDFNDASRMTLFGHTMESYFAFPCDKDSVTIYIGEYLTFSVINNQLISPDGVQLVYIEDYSYICSFVIEHVSDNYKP